MIRVITFSPDLLFTSGVITTGFARVAAAATGAEADVVASA
jgi:hypothetical protein